MSWRFWTHSIMPQREKSSPKWCSTQAVEERSTMTQQSDERCILGLVMFGYWRVMVVLDWYLCCLMCWIVIYCICVYCCLYIVHLVGRLPSRGGRQNRKNIKKFVMFVGSPTNIRAMWGKPWLVGFATWQLCSSGNQQKIRPTWHQDQRGPTWHTFVGQVEPTIIRVLGSSVPPGRWT
jgi:hypothetical protein